jgi:hypothetical protein
MEADDHRNVFRLGNAAQQRQDVNRRRRIEACHRFIGEDQLGLLRQRAGDADALLLAPAQTVHSFQRLAGQADLLETCHCQKLVLPRQRQEATKRAVIADAPGEHVVERRISADELVLLKDHAGSEAMIRNGSSALELA